MLNAHNVWCFSSNPFVLLYCLFHFFPFLLFLSHQFFFYFTTYFSVVFFLIKKKSLFLLSFLSSCLILMSLFLSIIPFLACPFSCVFNTFHLLFQYVFSPTLSVLISLCCCQYGFTCLLLSRVIAAVFVLLQLRLDLMFVAWSPSSGCYFIFAPIKKKHLKQVIIHISD
jgi:hypothetical protein